MKKSLVLSAVLFASISVAFAGGKLKEKNVPEKVKAAFKAQYPKVEKAGWEAEKENFEAEFKNGKEEMSVVISPEGKIMATETKIAIAELPEGARAYVAKNLPGKKIKDAERIINSDDQTIYEAEVGGMDYLFDAKGQFLKSEK